MSKPTVHYRGKPVVFGIGLSAVLESVVDHPGHLLGHDISNDPGKVVQTSSVVAYDEATGRIETRNTVYVPEVKE